MTVTIRLLAIDLDETLLDKTLAVSPRARDAIGRAMAQGVTVTVATGRMYRSALPYALQLNLDVPLITYNGALIKCSLSGETLLHRPLDGQVATDVLAFFRARGWYIQSYVDDVLYVRERDETALYYERRAGVTAVAIGDRIFSPAVAPTKLLTIASPQQITEVQAALAAEFGDRLYLARSKPDYLEITDPSANKGQALAFLAGRLGIGREQVMAIGDSPNDLDMIEYAGWGVAMGNAADHIKAAAQAVTAGNDADGAAEAIEVYILQGKA
jgi:Cof subfamily protein (haloacid dehalogenase superfamily)